MIAIISNLRKGKPQNRTTDSETGWLKNKKRLGERPFARVSFSNQTRQSNAMFYPYFGEWSKMNDPKFYYGTPGENWPLSINIKIQLDREA